MALIDAHLHVWDTARFCYPWLDEVPQLNRDFTLKDYRESLKFPKTLTAILVESDVSQAHRASEAQWYLDLADIPENRIAGIVACVDPESPNFVSVLNAINSSKLRGIRSVLYKKDLSIAMTARFVRNVKKIGQYGLTFDLCITQNQLRDIGHLLDKCPGVSFVLDHCGNPRILNTADFNCWKNDIANLAQRANVNCKFSGLLSRIPPSQHTPERLWACFSHVLNAFGWKRIIWGSDWPVCTQNAQLSDWLTMTTALLDIANASDVQREQFFHLNAAEIYRLHN